MIYPGNQVYVSDAHFQHANSRVLPAQLTIKSDAAALALYDNLCRNLSFSPAARLLSRSVDSQLYPASLLPEAIGREDSDGNRLSRMERRTPSLRLLLLRLFLASDPFEKRPAFGPLGVTLDKSLG